MLTLTFGASASDRILPLLSGEITIDDVSPQWNILPVQALFNKQLVDHAWDVVEFPVASYLRDLDNAKRYLALPVFPSRHFRFSSVYTHRAAGLKKPADLAGKRIGIPVWDMAAAVWLRGIFAQYYDLPAKAPIYVTNGLEAARSGDEHPQFYPADFTIEQSDAEGGLAGMLARGEIDALYTARAPSTWDPSDPDCAVAPLFDDVMAAEADYYATSKILPPMHLWAVKRDIAEANPALTQALFDAFHAAEKAAQARIFDSSALSVMLPWAMEHILETERLLGKHYWQGGFAANRHMFEALIRYTHQDGLISTMFQPEDLFDAAMLAT